MQIFLHVTENDFILLSDKYIDATDCLSLPWFELRKENLIDFMMAESAVASALVPAKEVMVGLIPMESPENADFLASAQADAPTILCDW